jgi:hypothetical protein
MCTAFITLMMAAVHTSAVLVYSNNTAQHYIPEGSHVQMNISLIVKKTQRQRQLGKCRHRWMYM